MTEQLDLWKSDFGVAYAERGNNTIGAENIRRLHRDWGKILSRAVGPYPISALEVGCNIGRNLMVLQHYIETLYGIEPNVTVIEKAKTNPALAGVALYEGQGASLPFEDSSIDLVFTSGVLIHVAPENLRAVVDEIHRVAKHYIVCIEYFSHDPVQMDYHGRQAMLFKRDFGGYYLDCFPGLRVVDYGFLWARCDSSDNSNWWLFEKR